MQAVTNHFQGVFTASPTTDLDTCLDGILILVTKEMNDSLNAMASEQEKKEAMLSLGSLKAPGPDGLNGLFYKTHWETIKVDICNSVQNFFATGTLPEEVNEAVVALVPKTPLPESVLHYRPISCCNFMYKIISKIYVSRLKCFMDSLISPNQSAFIGGRLIQDNIIIAHEVFMHSKRTLTRGATKWQSNLI